MRCVMFCLFFFFKQKTAYEMRISDWSSDVCSSDLLAFANIRETAGWSGQGADAGPKAAALLAMAAEPAAVPTAVTLSSNGVILVYGRDQTAIEVGDRKSVV